MGEFLLSHLVKQYGLPYLKYLIAVQDQIVTIVIVDPVYKEILIVAANLGPDIEAQKNPRCDSHDHVFDRFIHQQVLDIVSIHNERSNETNVRSDVFGKQINKTLRNNAILIEKEDVCCLVISRHPAKRVQGTRHANILTVFDKHHICVNRKYLFDFVNIIRAIVKNNDPINLRSNCTDVFL